MALQKANLEVNDMKRTYEKKSAQTLTSVKPTTLNLQTRGFAPPQTNLDEEIPRQAKGSTSENLLEKLISNPSSESSTEPIQRKSQNRLKASQTKISTPIQAKLNIGEPNDKYEQEADDTASKVVQQINSPIQDQSVQREESMEEEDEELQMKSVLQRRENVGGGEASTDLESSIQSARGGGQSLDPSLQTKMGQAMGADFSGVKVHTDSQSDQLNKSIQAKAFTTGQDVFFRQGAYAPSSKSGQELIAHELTHVVQQNGGTVQRSPQSLERIGQQSTAKTASTLPEDGVIQRMSVHNVDVASTLLAATQTKHVEPAATQQARADAEYGSRTFVTQAADITDAVDANAHNFAELNGTRSARFDFNADVAISVYMKTPPNLGAGQPSVQTINNQVTNCEIGVVKTGTDQIQVTHFKMA